MRSVKCTSCPSTVEEGAYFVVVPVQSFESAVLDAGVGDDNALESHLHHAREYVDGMLGALQLAGSAHPDVRVVV